MLPRRRAGFLESVMCVLSCICHSIKARILLLSRHIGSLDTGVAAQQISQRWLNALMDSDGAPGKLYNGKRFACRD